MILLAKSLPGLCPHVEQGDDGASSRVQNDFANNIKNSDVLQGASAHAGASSYKIGESSFHADGERDGQGRVSTERGSGA